MRNAGIHGHAAGNTLADAAMDGSGDEWDVADEAFLDVGSLASHLGTAGDEDEDQEPLATASL
jgi:hypothetical protein